MTVRILLALLLLFLGTLVLAVSVLGLFRLRDVLERLHAGALADTLGALLMLSGLGLLWGFSAQTVKLALLLAILWLTAPVASHLVVRMELITGRDLDPGQLEGEGEEEL